jgi:muramidase (phage lysozyme)
MEKLLTLIRWAEASGNYNAFYAHAYNKDQPDFSKMTVRQVRTWQDEYIRKGSKSSAVGAYQIIRKTMDDIMKHSSIPIDSLFDDKTQDIMAMYLLRKRGLNSYLAGNATKEAFANQLAKEWASFPVIGGPKHGQSFYAGDGLNHARVKPEQVMEALSA